MTGSLPVSSSKEIPSQVSLMLSGVMSSKGTGFGIFIKVGTVSATAILSSENAPKPTPF